MAEAGVINVLQGEKDVVSREEHEDIASYVSSRLRLLKTERSEYEDTWDDIIDYVVPRRISTDIHDHPSDPPRQMYDGTASHSCQILADGLLSYLLSPQAPWFRLILKGDPKNNTSKEVKEYIEHLESVFSYVFETSNFYSAMNEALLDGCSIGTACVLVDIADGEVFFSARNPNELYIATDHSGKVDTVFREYRQTARNIVNRFPDSPERVKELATENPDKCMTVVHAVYPNRDRDPMLRDNLNKRFRSVYMIESEDYVLETSGYDRFPFAIWRYRTNSSEVYGTSPAWDALSDIKTAQVIMKTLLEKSHQSVAPPVMAPREMRGSLSLEANGVSWYSDPARQVIPIQNQSQYPVGKDMLATVQDQIRNHFRTDFFLSQNEATQKSHVAAFTISVLNAEKAAALSSPVTRLEKEFLSSIFDAVFQIARAYNWVPDPPASLEKPIEVQYTGPLSLMQIRHLNQQNLVQGLSDYSQFIQVWPELARRLDVDELSDRWLEVSGVPQTAIKSDKTIAQERQQEQQAQAQAAQMEAAQMEADVYQKTSKAPEQGSVAKEMTG